jgi:hypothetical protein
MARRLKEYLSNRDMRQNRMLDKQKLKTVLIRSDIAFTPFLVAALSFKGQFVFSRCFGYKMIVLQKVSIYNAPP